ncbi:MAG: DUF1847 domain-containing protein [Spirochaetia bacterium]|jgi:uncharacterized metal-binding protein|nr:DUF1847 domain-containing protein [Spirochaetia bacterium]
MGIPYAYLWNTQEIQDMDTVYDESSLELMKIADKTSDMSINRIQEIRNFALNGNYQRIGIAHCITFSTEAQIIKEYLEKHFTVYTVDCKFGRLRRQDLFGGNSQRILCNPAGQAQYLNEKKTDLNISLGLCVGHDMIFNQKSLAPVTSLFTKDFTNNNDPAKAVSAIKREL